MELGDQEQAQTNLCLHQKNLIPEFLQEIINFWGVVTILIIIVIHIELLHKETTHMCNFQQKKNACVLGCAVRNEVYFLHVHTTLNMPYFVQSWKLSRFRLDKKLDRRNYTLSTNVCFSCSEPRTLCRVGNCSTTELCPSPPKYNYEREEKRTKLL